MLTGDKINEFQRGARKASENVKENGDGDHIIVQCNDKLEKRG
jgi:hypothetical protein